MKQLKGRRVLFYVEVGILALLFGSGCLYTKRKALPPSKCPSFEGAAEKYCGKTRTGSILISLPQQKANPKACARVCTKRLRHLCLPAGREDLDILYILKRVSCTTLKGTTQYRCSYAIYKQCIISCG